MSVFIEIQNTIESNNLPSESSHLQWIEAALKAAKKKDASLNVEEPEITIRLVSEPESHQLNSDYRQKDKPTNVLSFPFEFPDMIPSDELPNYLGDLVICEAVLQQEAKSQNKSYQAHYTHLLIHGLLHLLGFDHIEAPQAAQMEALEIEILASFDIANPYIANS
jgi:probable rRNA maturation factor